MFKRQSAITLTSYAAWLLAWLVIALALSLTASVITAAKAAEIETEINAGSLRAMVMADGSDSKQVSGAKVYTTIKITDSRRRGEAVIDLEVTGGRITDVSGRRIDVSGDGPKQTITVSRLRRKKGRTIEIEVELGAKNSGVDTDNKTVLGITLRDEDTGSSASHEVSWTFRNCAGAYHAALANLKDGIAKDMKMAQRRLRRKDDALPGRWLFAKRNRRQLMRRARRQHSRFCLKYELQAGKSQCIQWEKSSTKLRSLVKLSRRERGLLGFVAEFVERRGYAPEFGNNGRYRWLTLRVSGDLRSYIAQAPNPALCSGTQQFLTFHKRNMSPFKRRTKKVIKMVERGHELAMQRMSALLAAIAVKQHEEKRSQAALGAAGRTQSRVVLAASKQATLDGELPAPATPAINTTLKAPSSPPISATPQEAEQTASAPQARKMPETYLGMINELARIVLPKDRLFALKVETLPLSALRHLRAELRKLPKRGVVSRDAQVMAGVLTSLQVIEAGVYVDQLNDRYDGINNGIDGTIDEIAAAYKKTCTCRP